MIGHELLPSGWMDMFFFFFFFFFFFQRECNYVGLEIREEKKKKKKESKDGVVSTSLVQNYGSVLCRKIDCAVVHMLSVDAGT